MKRIVTVMMVTACGSNAHDPGVGSTGSAPPPAAVAGARGYLLWQQPTHPLSDEAVLVRPNDHLVLMDLAKRESVDLGASPMFRITDVSPSSDGVALGLGFHVAHVHFRDGKATIEPPTGVDPRTDSIIDNITAIAPDGSTAARWSLAGLCVAKPDVEPCADTIAMPTLEHGSAFAATYVSPTRIVVSAAMGELKSGEPGFGWHVVAASIDLTTKTVTPIELPAATGERIYVAPDGRIAWNEVVNGNIVVATATVDDPAQKATYIVGPAEAQAFAECAWGGPMLVCVARPDDALISIDTRTRTQTTLAANVFPKKFSVSKDGAWVVYFTTHKKLLGTNWHVSPTDKAAASEGLRIPEDAEPLAWL